MSFNYFVTLRMSTNASAIAMTSILVRILGSKVIFFTVSITVLMLSPFIST
jgi:hypothetical protein